MAAVVIVLVGLYLLALSTDKIPLKDAFVDISPDRVSYRLNFYGRAYSLDWSGIAAIHFSDHCVLFDLRGGHQRSLLLTGIESHNKASQVALGLQMAALEHNITVNGVRFNVPGPATGL
ncbi:hypothetical protein GCM10011323_27540 [Pontibacter amylolyticus]|uniref:Uncharacterized protein n=2 Tax=Pontibacter amylolyticus TaxID=1424080 RepID=A0ABQ1WBU4_9BACT|nr:hypothetical protein GCM10011323_27540 [Pontibacter amylolyticus]